MNNEILLPLLILIPFLTGFICWIADKTSQALPRWIALLGMSATLFLVLSLWHNYGGALTSLDHGQWAAEYNLSWMPTLGISFYLAIDGLSLLMVGLTAVLGILAIGCSWGEIQKNVGFFHLNLLWSLAGVIGVFMALDLFLFFFFWELMLVPIYFLIALWGHKGSTGKSRVHAATKFFIYTQASGLVMLVGILILVMIHYTLSGNLTFNYNALLATPLPSGWEYALMLMFFIAFAVKLPMFPFHGWLPDAHAQAPTAGSVDLAGILIKTAAYGLIRFVLPLFPHASAEFAPIAIGLGLIGVFYGAILAFAQSDIKRLLAYTSISHMGFILLALYAGNLMSLQGIMIMMLAHGLSSAALFIMSGQIYERLHTRDMAKMGGMWGQFRYLPFFLMFFAAALAGIPGTGNFIGEFLILLGSFNKYPVLTTIATVSVVFAGVYALIMIHRALFGKMHEDTQKHTSVQFDLNLREKMMLLSLVGGLLWLGLVPNSVLKISEPAMRITTEAYTQPLFQPLVPKQQQVDTGYKTGEIQ